jgi:hypothetical protein
LLTPYTRLRLAGGYQTLQFDGSSNRNIEFVRADNPNAGGFFRPGAEQNGSGDEETFYLNFVLANQLSRLFQHTLTVSKEAQLGITSQSVDLWSANYLATWTVNSWLTLQARLLFDDGAESGSAREEKFQRWGGSLATDLQISRKVRVTFGYDFIHKDSDLPAQSYTRNLIFAEFHLAF